MTKVTKAKKLQLSWKHLSIQYQSHIAETWLKPTVFALHRSYRQLGHISYWKVPPFNVNCLGWTLKSRLQIWHQQYSQINLLVVQTTPYINTLNHLVVDHPCATLSVRSLTQTCLPTRAKWVEPLSTLKQFNEFHHHSAVKAGARFSIKAFIPSRRSFCNNITSKKLIRDRAGTNQNKI